MNKKRIAGIGVIFVLAAASGAVAQTKPASPLSRDQPIEISSDKLDVFQEDHKAVFTGNVIAVQGTTNMRAAEMVVYYKDDGVTPTAATHATPVAKPAAKTTEAGAAGQGITQIDANGNVVFTTPTETALGDKAIYHVDTETIDLTGKNVTLTRDQNVLKGTHLIHNMATGRSVLTSGGTPVKGSVAGKPARVHGLFVPKPEKPTATEKPISNKPASDKK